MWNASKNCEIATSTVQQYVICYSMKSPSCMFDKETDIVQHRSKLHLHMPVVRTVT